MQRFAFVLAALVVAVTCFPSEIPAPGELALVFNEEDFEDYLDAWLELEEPKWANASQAQPRSGKYPKSF